MKQHRIIRLCRIVALLLLINFAVGQGAVLFANEEGGALVENVLIPPSDIGTIVTAPKVLNDFNFALSASTKADDEQVEIAVSAQLACMILATIISEAQDELFASFVASIAAENLAEKLPHDLFSSLDRFGSLIAQTELNNPIKKLTRASLLRLSGRLPGAFYFNAVSPSQAEPVAHEAFLSRIDRLEKLLGQGAKNQQTAILIRKSMNFVFQSATYSRYNLLYPVSFFLPIALMQVSEHSYFELLPADVAKDHSYLVSLAALQSITGKLLANTGFELDAHANGIREQNAALRDYQAKLSLAFNISRGLLEDKSAKVSARNTSDADMLARFMRNFSEIKVRQILRSKYRPDSTWNTFSYHDLFAIPEFSEGLERLLVTGTLALGAYNAALGQANTISRFNTQLLISFGALLDKIEAQVSAAAKFEELSDPVKAWYPMTVDEIRESIKVLRSRNEAFTRLTDPENAAFCGGVLRNYRADSARINKDLTELFSIHANFNYLEVTTDPDSDLAKILFLSD